MRSSALVATGLLVLAGCAPDEAEAPAAAPSTSADQVSGPLLGASHVLVPAPAADGVLVVSGPPEGATGDHLVLARWDGTAWHDIDGAEDGPGALSFFAAAHDPDRDVVVVHGGETADGVSGETWVWDGTTWRRPTADGPGPRMAASMAWDPASRTTVLQGGHDADGDLRPDTWAFDGEAWTRLADRGPTPGRWPAALLATGDGALVAYGGHQVVDDDLPPALGDTWRWHDRAWRQVSDASGPGPLVNAQAVLHPDLGPLMLGGSDLRTESGDVWRWGGERWEPFARDVLPRRQAFGAAYDAQRDVIVLTGGVVEPGATTRHQDVWEWSGDPDRPAELVADRPPA